MRTLLAIVVGYALMLLIPFALLAGFGQLGAEGEIVLPQEISLGWFGYLGAVAAGLIGGGMAAGRVAGPRRHFACLAIGALAMLQMIVPVVTGDPGASPPFSITCAVLAVPLLFLGGVLSGDPRSAATA